MEYLYQQQPIPANTTGVPVTISVVDANGNFRQIGTATSDAYGNYAFTWTPDISGNFNVIASFAGSNSYYGSSASTTFYAGDAATPAPTQVTAQPVDNTMTIAAIGVAIIIVIVIVGVILALMIRKRP